MKILHLISQHPGCTGSGMYLRNVIARSAFAGHENFLIAGVSGDPPPMIPWLADAHSFPVRFNSGALPFSIPGMSDVMPYSSSRFRDLTKTQLAAYRYEFGKTISEAARIIQPDLIHSHHLWIVTGLACTLLPAIPVITTCHSTDLRQFALCSHLRGEVQENCRRLRRVLALSREQVGRISACFGQLRGKITVVGGGFDSSMFKPGEKAPPPPVNLLYAGKLSHAKGVDILLDAVALAGDINIHLHLAGSGSGEEAESCLSKINQLGDRVTFYGHIGQDELATLMRACHLFILPSFYEGLPLVVLEALASGCRIIATDLPGCRELLAAADGELVSFVPLPRMKSIDEPVPAERHKMVRQLLGAIDSMSARIRSQPAVPEDTIASLTCGHTWQAVYQRIEEVYRQVG